MKKSKLENIGNIQLFFLIKQIILNSGYSLKTITQLNNIIEQDGFLETCDEAGRILGIFLEKIDYNYIVSTINLNKDFDFESPKPLGEIKRPKINLYKVDVDEFRTEYVRRTYVHEIESYSPNLVISTLTVLEHEGTISWYEGRELDADYYDGETTNVRIDKDSIRKIS
jgi:hypothetical protein